MNKIAFFTIATLYFLFFVEKIQLYAQNNVVNKQTIGVVAYQATYKAGNIVAINDSKGKLSRKIKVDGNLSSEKDLEPFALSGEYDLLVFDCIGQNSMYYKVITNSNNKSVGYIMKSQANMHFETWPEHIQKHIVAVDVDKDDLHVSPSMNSRLIKNINAEIYFMKEVKGNWIKVEWKLPRRGVGWTQWWDPKKKLLIPLFYNF